MYSTELTVLFFLGGMCPSVNSDYSKPIRRV